jgi:hypothetical protein
MCQLSKRNGTATAAWIKMWHLNDTLANPLHGNTFPQNMAYLKYHAIEMATWHMSIPLNTRNPWKLSRDGCMDHCIKLLRTNLEPRKCAWTEDFKIDTVCSHPWDRSHKWATSSQLHNCHRSLPPMRESQLPNTPPSGMQGGSRHMELDGKAVSALTTHRLLLRAGGMATAADLPILT